MNRSRYALYNGYERGSEPEIVSGDGPWLIAKDGSRFLDMGLGAGSQILGHAHPTIVKSIQEQVKKGTVYLANHPYIHTLCDQLSSILPEQQKHFIFCNSGSEATQRALRLARAATDKERIACFQGGWHGMNEWTLCDDGSRLGIPCGVLPSGIPSHVLDSSLQLPYNVDEAFTLLEQHSSSLAALIIEPIQGSNPRDDILPFLRRLSDFCKHNEIQIIMDEIITGFRLGISGASGLWNLSPDIVTYGKILGGGLPVGLVTCTDTVAEKTFACDTSYSSKQGTESAKPSPRGLAIEALRALQDTQFGRDKEHSDRLCELEQRLFGDTSTRKHSKKILTGGTFSANPLVAVAASAVLHELQQQDYSALDALSDRLRDQLNLAFAWSGLPLRVMGCSSFNRLVFTDQHFHNRQERDALEQAESVQRRFREALLARGIIWPANGLIFLGFCHNTEIVDQVCDAVLASAVDAFSDHRESTSDHVRNGILADRLLSRRLLAQAPKLNGLPLSSVSDSDRSGNSIFILGSGASINGISADQWQKLKQTDTLGVNYFYFHEFRPQMHFVELGRSNEARDAIHELLLNDSERSNEKVYLQIRHLLRIGQKLDAGAGRAVLYSPMIFKTRDTNLLQDLLKKHYLSSDEAEPLIHHASTLDCAIHFAVKKGYRNIYLLGVDLRKNEYFWDADSSNSVYERARKVVNADYQIGKWSRDPGLVHATANQAMTEKLDCLDVCTYLKLVDNSILNPAGISLKVCNPDSLLTDYLQYSSLDTALKEAQS